MSDYETVRDAWSALLTLGGGVLLYFAKKRDKVVDDHASEIKRIDAEKSKLELKISENYATKESLRVMFQESQASTREMGNRLEKQIDETKSEIKTTNTKIDTMQQTILAELAKK